MIAEEPVTVDGAARDASRVLAWGHELLQEDVEEGR
jgi:hypothetical protein